MLQLQGAIHDLVGTARVHMEQAPAASGNSTAADEHSLPGQEYEAFMTDLEACLLEELQQEQNAAEAEDHDQAEADELAELIAACSIDPEPQSLGAASIARQLNSCGSEALLGSIPCPVCTAGQLSVAAHRQICCASANCLVLPLDRSCQLTLQGLHYRTLQLAQQHAASECAGLPAFGLAPSRRDAVFACFECGVCDSLVGR